MLQGVFWEQGVFILMKFNFHSPLMDWSWVLRTLPKPWVLVCSRLHSKGFKFHILFFVLGPFQVNFFFLMFKFVHLLTKKGASPTPSIIFHISGML